MLLKLIVHKDDARETLGMYVRLVTLFTLHIMTYVCQAQFETATYEVLKGHLFGIVHAHLSGGQDGG